MSVTSDANAEADPLPKNVRDLLAVPAPERSPEQVQTIFRYWRSTVPEWKQENEAIAAPLMEVMGQIQFQDIIRQQLEQVSATTRAVDHHLSELASELVQPTARSRQSLQDRLDAIFSAYVMDQQRVSHRSAEGQQFHSDQNMAIELF